MNIDIVYIICSIVCFVIAIVFHEVMHGFAAHKLGDPTAKRAGRLTLNPLKHVDPFGTVVMPLMLAILGWPVFGYAKPVPYNPAYFKDPRKGDLIVGLAGPAANLFLALVGSALAWGIAFLIQSTNMAESLLSGSELFGQILLYAYFLVLPMFILVNLYLAFFNILPIPPLDGSSILAVILPPKYLPQYYRIQQYALPLFMILVLVVPYVFNVNPIGLWLDVTAGNVFNLLYPWS